MPSVAAIGAQIAAALAAAHAAGIVHRDVKPANVLIARTPGGGEPFGQHPPTAKLTDFGISHAATSPALTSTGILTGTPGYLAPETARGGGSDPRSDVYSLGATLYAAVEGHPPFGTDEDNVLALLARIGRGGAPPPLRAGPLTGLLRRLTADDPDARPTAAQAWHELQILSGLPPAPVLPTGAPTFAGHIFPAPPPAWQPPPPTRRRRGFLVAGIALAVVAVIAAAVLAATRNRAGPGTPVADAPPIPAPPVTIGAVTIGDPRTADPCSLLDVSAVSGFGQAMIDRGNSWFSSCRADFPRPPGGSGVSVFVDFQSWAESSDDGPAAQYEQIGEVTLARYAGASDSCERRLVLSDRNVVSITADIFDYSSPADLCAIADGATDGAVAILAERGIGTRVPLDVESPLAGIDACGLLGPDDLAIVSAGATGTTQRWFGGWGCVWTGFGSGNGVRLEYYRRYSLTAEDGVPTDFGGRAGAVGPRRGGVCIAQFPQKSHVTGDGRQTIDLVRVYVYGTRPDTDLCGAGTALAAAAAGRLPSPS